MTTGFHRLRLIWIVLLGLVLVTTGSFATIGGYDVAKCEFIAAKTPLAAAEAEQGADLVSLAKVKHKPAVVVGAVDPATGKAVAGRSYKGCCAEREAADVLGGGDKAIQFTKPVRPRTGEVIPRLQRVPEAL